MSGEAQSISTGIRRRRRPIRRGARYLALPMIAFAL
jgi:hypothetical protein